MPPRSKRPARTPRDSAAPPALDGQELRARSARAREASKRLRDAYAASINTLRLASHQHQLVVDDITVQFRDLVDAAGNLARVLRDDGRPPEKVIVAVTSSLEPGLGTDPLMRQKLRATAVKSAIDAYYLPTETT
jgi:hypothetical protein